MANTKKPDENQVTQTDLASILAPPSWSQAAETWTPKTNEEIKTIVSEAEQKGQIARNDSGAFEATPKLQEEANIIRERNRENDISSIIASSPTPQGSLSIAKAYQDSGRNIEAAKEELKSVTQKAEERSENAASSDIKRQNKTFERDKTAWRDTEGTTGSKRNELNEDGSYHWEGHTDDDGNWVSGLAEWTQDNETRLQAATDFALDGNWHSEEEMQVYQQEVANLYYDNQELESYVQKQVDEFKAQYDQSYASASAEEKKNLDATLKNNEDYLAYVKGMKEQSKSVYDTLTSNNDYFGQWDKKQDVEAEVNNSANYSGGYTVAELEEKADYYRQEISRLTEKQKHDYTKAEYGSYRDAQKAAVEDWNKLEGYKTELQKIVSEDKSRPGLLQIAREEEKQIRDSVEKANRYVDFGREYALKKTADGGVRSYNADDWKEIQASLLQQRGALDKNSANYFAEKQAIDDKLDYIVAVTGEDVQKEILNKWSNASVEELAAHINELEYGTETPTVSTSSTPGKDSNIQTQINSLLREMDGLNISNNADYKRYKELDAQVKELQLSAAQDTGTEAVQQESTQEIDRTPMEEYELGILKRLQQEKQNKELDAAYEKKYGGMSAVDAYNDALDEVNKNYTDLVTTNSFSSLLNEAFLRQGMGVANGMGYAESYVDRTKEGFKTEHAEALENYAPSQYFLAKATKEMDTALKNNKDYSASVQKGKANAPDISYLRSTFEQVQNYMSNSHGLSGRAQAQKALTEMGMSKSEAEDMMALLSAGGIDARYFTPTSLELDAENDPGSHLAYGEKLGFFNEDETNNFYYLWEKEGAASAMRYAMGVNNILNSEYKSMLQENKAYNVAYNAENSPLGFAAFAAGSPVVSALTGMTALPDYLKTVSQVGATGMSFTAPTMSVSEYGEMLNEVYTNQVGTSVADATNGFIPESVARFGYGVYGSIIQSQMTQWMGSGLASALGLSAEGAVALGKSAHELAAGAFSDITFFSSAAMSSYRDFTQNRGVEPGTALLASTFAGIAEAAFEHFSFDKLYHAKDTKDWTRPVVEWVKNTAVSAGIEGSEEGFTTIANYISEGIILGKDSSFRRSLNEFQLQGYDFDTAYRLAFDESVKSLALDIAAGALSGGISVGATSVVSYNKDKANIKSQAEIFGERMTKAKTKDGTTLAQKLGEYIVNYDFAKATDAVPLTSVQQKELDTLKTLAQKASEGKATDKEVAQIKYLADRFNKQLYLDFAAANLDTYMEVSLGGAKQASESLLVAVLGEEEAEAFLKAYNENPEAYIEDSFKQGLREALGESYTTEYAEKVEGLMGYILSGNAAYDEETMRKQIQEVISDDATRNFIVDYFKDRLDQYNQSKNRQFTLFARNADPATQPWFVHTTSREALVGNFEDSLINVWSGVKEAVRYAGIRKQAMDGIKTAVDAFNDAVSKSSVTAISQYRDNGDFFITKDKSGKNITITREVFIDSHKNGIDPITGEKSSFTDLMDDDRLNAEFDGLLQAAYLKGDGAGMVRYNLTTGKERTRGSSDAYTDFNMEDLRSQINEIDKQLEELYSKSEEYKAQGGDTYQQHLDAIKTLEARKAQVQSDLKILEAREKVRQNGRTQSRNSGTSGRNANADGQRNAGGIPYRQVGSDGQNSGGPATVSTASPSTGGSSGRTVQQVILQDGDTIVASMENGSVVYDSSDPKADKTKLTKDEQDVLQLAEDVGVDRLIFVDADQLYAVGNQAAGYFTTIDGKKTIFLNLNRGVVNGYHEAMHYMLSSYTKEEKQALLGKFITTIFNNKEEANAFLDRYDTLAHQQAYAKTYDPNQPGGGRAYNFVLMEEMLCDLWKGLNRYNTGSEQFAALQQKAYAFVIENQIMDHAKASKQNRNAEQPAEVESEEKAETPAETTGEQVENKVIQVGETYNKPGAGRRLTSYNGFTVVRYGSTDQQWQRYTTLQGPDGNTYTVNAGKTPARMNAAIKAFVDGWYKLHKEYTLTTGDITAKPTTAERSTEPKKQTNSDISDNPAEDLPAPKKKPRGKKNQTNPDQMMMDEFQDGTVTAEDAVTEITNTVVGLTREELAQRVADFKNTLHSMSNQELTQLIEDLDRLIREINMEQGSLTQQFFTAVAEEVAGEFNTRYAAAQARREQQSVASEQDTAQELEEDYWEQIITSPDNGDTVSRREFVDRVTSGVDGFDGIGRVPVMTEAEANAEFDTWLDEQYEAEQQGLYSTETPDIYGKFSVESISNGTGYETLYQIVENGKLITMEDWIADQQRLDPDRGREAFRNDFSEIVNEGKVRVYGLAVRNADGSLEEVPVERVNADAMKNSPLGQLITYAKDYGRIDEDEANRQYGFLAELMKLLYSYDDTDFVWKIVGSEMFAGIKNNSDPQYVKTIDFSTICKKTQATIDAISKTMKLLGTGLSKEEIKFVYKMVGEAGESTPCPVCYVFSRWMGLGSVLDNIRRYQDMYGSQNPQGREEALRLVKEVQIAAVAKMKSNKKLTFGKAVNAAQSDASKKLRVAETAFANYEKALANPGSKKYQGILEDQNGNQLTQDYWAEQINFWAKEYDKYDAYKWAIKTRLINAELLVKGSEDIAAKLRKDYKISGNTADEVLENALKSDNSSTDFGELVNELSDNLEDLRLVDADRLADLQRKYQLKKSQSGLKGALTKAKNNNLDTTTAQQNLDANLAEYNEIVNKLGSDEYVFRKGYKDVPDDILFDLNKGEEFAKYYPETWTYRTTRGSGLGKAIMPYSDARVGETIQGVALGDVKGVKIGANNMFLDLLDPKKKEQARRVLATARRKMAAQNLIGGMRFQSTSDFRYEYASDYLLAFFEMQAMGANVQLYTKVLEAVDFFASVGCDVNLSVMPRDKGLGVLNEKPRDWDTNYDRYYTYENGKYVKLQKGESAPEFEPGRYHAILYSDVTGVNGGAAKEYVQKYDNVQMIMVGISADHINACLDSDDITFVIPFHGSGNSTADIQQLMQLLGESIDRENITDFTEYQVDFESKDATPQTKAARDLRHRIVSGALLDKDGKLVLTDEDINTLKANRFLSDLFRRFYLDATDANGNLDSEQITQNFLEDALRRINIGPVTDREFYNKYYLNGYNECYHNFLSGAAANQIFPFEYWDKSLKQSEAKANGDAFQAYCKSLGLVPRFSGWSTKGKYDGNLDFTKNDNYWKLLIDRKMYDNRGNYRAQRQIDLSNVDIGESERFNFRTLNPTYGEVTFGSGSEFANRVNPKAPGKNNAVISKINDPRKTDAIAAIAVKGILDARAKANGNSSGHQFSEDADIQQAMEAKDYITAANMLAENPDVKFREEDGELVVVEQGSFSLDAEQLDEYRPQYVEAIQQMRDKDANGNFLNNKTIFDSQEALLQLFERVPDLDYLKRIAFAKDKKEEKQIRAEFSQLLSGINDRDSLWQLGAYSYYPSTGRRELNPATGKWRLIEDVNWAEIEKIKAAERKFSNTIEKRRDEILRNSGVSSNLKLQERDYSLQEIRQLFNQLNQDEQLAPLADKVFRTAETLGLTLRVRNGKAFRSSDVHGHALGSIVEYNINRFNDLGVTNQGKASTLLHELIHSCTQYAITAYEMPEYNISLNKDMRTAVETLRSVYNEIKADPVLGKSYAAVDMHEMLAVLSSPRFREALEKKSLWERVVDAIKRFFGIDTTNALDAASVGLNYLLDNVDYNAYLDYVEIANRQQDGGYYATQKAEQTIHVGEVKTDEGYWVKEEDAAQDGWGRWHRKDDTFMRNGKRFYYDEVSQEWTSIKPNRFEVSGIEVYPNNDATETFTDSNGNTITEGSFSLDRDGIASVTYFAGSGTLDYALNNRLMPLLAVEYDPKIRDMFVKNNGNAIMVTDADVNDVEPGAVIAGHVDYFHASPVCKNFSRANNKSGETEMDRSFAQSIAKALQAWQPKVFTLENVAGYRGSESLKMVTDTLDALGYNWDVDVYRASDYGAATIRDRLFVRAVKEGELPPKPIKTQSTSWWSAVSDIVDELPTMDDSGLTAARRARLDKMGIDINNLEQPILLLSGTKGGEIMYAYADQPSPTLMTDGSEARIILTDGTIKKVTPRVYARIQGLDDQFMLPAKRNGETHQTDAFKIVGNGVPTQLTRAIVSPLLDTIERPEGSFSLDSDGNQLSESQAQYFANSKVRDELGRLLKLYHGTRSWGFTIVDPRRANDGISFFMTDNPDIANSYKAGRTNVRSLFDNVYEGQAADLPNEVFASVYQELFPDRTITNVSSYADQFNRQYQNANHLLNSYKQKAQELVARLGLADVTSEYLDYLNSVDLSQRLNVLDAQDYAEYLLDEITRTNIGYAEKKTIREAYQELKNSMNALSQILDYGEYNGLDVSSEAVIASIKETDSYGVEREYYSSKEDLAYELDKKRESNNLSAVYPLYANIVNPLVLDAEGRVYNDIKIPEDIYTYLNSLNDSTFSAHQSSDGYTTDTHGLSKYAKDNGYDGVIIKNCVDSGSISRASETSTIVVAFDANQIKDAKNLNPTEDPDMRFSLDIDPTAAYDAFGDELVMDFEALEDERQINSLRSQIEELGDAIDVEFDEGVERTLRNKLIKAQYELDKLVRKERSLTKKTSINDILENLDRYRYSDLESIAQQYSQSNWDIEPGTSKEQLASELREVLTEYAADLSMIERQNPRYGFSVRPVNTTAPQIIQFPGTKSALSDNLYYSSDENTAYYQTPTGETVVLNNVGPDSPEAQYINYLEAMQNANSSNTTAAQPYTIPPANRYESNGYNIGESNDGLRRGTEEVPSANQERTLRPAGSNGERYEQSQSQSAETEGVSRYSVEEDPAGRYATLYDPDTDTFVNEDGDVVATDDMYPIGSFTREIFKAMKSGDMALKNVEDIINSLMNRQYNLYEEDINTVRNMIQINDAITPQQKEALYKAMDELVKRYGGMRTAEEDKNKDVQFAKKTSEGKTIMKFTQTVARNADQEWLTDEAVRMALTDEAMSYTPMSNEEAIRRAQQRFDRAGSYEKALAEWDGFVRSEHTPKQVDIAFGELLLQQAAAEGRINDAVKLTSDLTILAHYTGQTLQAFRILKKMTPRGQLYYLQSVVNDLNKKYDSRIKSGKMGTLTLNQALVAQLLSSSTREELDNAVEAIKKDLAEHIPATWMDQWNAWRYLAMLGNPRTHIRNLIGNAAFMPAVFMKDMLARQLENKFVDPALRMRKAGADLSKDSAYMKRAEQDFEVMAKIIAGEAGGNKFSDIQDILGQRQIFKWGLLNKLEKLNGKALSAEDMGFMHTYYTRAFAEALQARGIKEADVQSFDTTREGRKTLNEIRNWAMIEAQRNTYHDANVLASTLNQLKAKSPVAYVILEGLVPFTKTPANILKRGIEYSPIGLISSSIKLAQDLRSGEYTTSQCIDRFAAGWTGTAFLALGYLLAKGFLGLKLRGEGPDDDKEAEFEELQGHQPWSLEVFGKYSFTIDWMAPIALPLFCGQVLYSTLHSDHPDLTDTDNWMFLLKLADPMLSLSMLDGIENTLSSVASAKDTSRLGVLGISMFGSYIAQGMPTFLGQVARVTDKDRRSTFIQENSKNSALNRFVQKSILSKLPDVGRLFGQDWYPSEENKMAFVDAWGRTDSSNTVLSTIWKVVENFLSPGYGNIINQTPVDAELQRLYGSTGENSVFPNTGAKYWNYGEGDEKVQKNLTKEEYEDFAKTRGQTAHEMLAQMFSSEMYQNATDLEKIKMVDNVYSYADKYAKSTITPEYELDKWMDVAQKIGPVDYILIKTEYEDNKSNEKIFAWLASNPNLNEDQVATLIASKFNPPDSVSSVSSDGFLYDLEGADEDIIREINADIIRNGLHELYSDPNYQNATDKDVMLKQFYEDARTQTLEAYGELLDQTDRVKHVGKAASIGADAFDMVLNLTTADIQGDYRNDVEAQASWLGFKYKADTTINNPLHLGYSLELDKTERSRLETRFRAAWNEAYNELVFSDKFKNAPSLEYQTDMVARRFNEVATQVENEYASELYQAGGRSEVFGKAGSFTWANAYQIADQELSTPKERAEWLATKYTPGSSLDDPDEAAYKIVLTTEDKNQIKKEFTSAYVPRYVAMVSSDEFKALPATTQEYKKEELRKDVAAAVQEEYARSLKSKGYASAVFDEKANLANKYQYLANTDLTDAQKIQILKDTYVGGTIANAEARGYRKQLYDDYLDNAANTASYLELNTAEGYEKLRSAADKYAGKATKQKYGGVKNYSDIENFDLYDVYYTTNAAIDSTPAVKFDESQKISGSSSLLQAGNIDLNSRPILRNSDGSYSTVDSVTYEIDGEYVNLPTVIYVEEGYSHDGEWVGEGWQHVSDEEALDHFFETGEHLGIYDSEKAAVKAAEQLHEAQARQYDSIASGYVIPPAEVTNRKKG